jgi:hypothetical protein
LAEAEAELRDVVAERLRGLKVTGAARAALDRYDDVPPRNNAEAKDQLWSDIRSPECADDLLTAVRRQQCVCSLSPGVCNGAWNRL